MKIFAGIGKRQDYFDNYNCYYGQLLLSVFSFRPVIAFQNFGAIT
jgi:hypothetical protein